jgi:hypothetical protein
MSIGLLPCVSLYYNWGQPSRWADLPTYPVEIVTSHPLDLRVANRLEHWEEPKVFQTPTCVCSNLSRFFGDSDQGSLLAYGPSCSGSMKV